MLSVILSLVTFGLGLVSALQYHGADFSSLLELEAGGVQFRTSPTVTPQPLEQILLDYGVNLARIRIWTSGTYDLDYALKLAKRANNVGMDIFVDLHYSDTWADPGQQTIPSGWPTDLDGLVSRVYEYTHEVVNAFNSQGIPIQIIQIGNEVNDGLLWPIGRASVSGFDGASRLFRAGALAVREASPSTQISIQLANGWNWSDLSWFFGGIYTSNTEEGLGGGLTESDVDIMAFSMYPYYGTDGTLANLNASMQNVASTYGKDIMIAETGFPATCDTTATPLSEPSIPVDADGQIEWVEDIKAILDNVNLIYGNKALGIVYWEPAWTSNPSLASTCSDVLLVTTDGVATESMTVFSDM